jgi:hypothetical protein
MLPPLASFPDWLKQHVAAQHSSSQLQLHQQQQQVANTAPYTPAAYPAAAAAAAAAQGGGIGSGQVWLKPTSLDQLVALLQRHCGSKRRARLVAGNTGVPADRLQRHSCCACRTVVKCSWLLSDVHGM